MRLRFIYQPVADLDAAIAFYRDELGLEEAWRDGAEMASFAVPGSSVQIMLDVADGTTSPFFVVPSVASFYEQTKDRLTFLEEPRAIGPGMLVRLRDPSGNVIRIMDDTTSRERS